MRFSSLSSLRQFVVSTLAEGKLEDLQLKFPDLDVKQIAESDPSGSSTKYLLWMLKQLAKSHSEDDLYPTIEFFHKNIQRFRIKDINGYPDLKDLEDACKELPTISKSQQKKQAKAEGVAIVFENDNCIVVRPDNKQTCMTYGAGTKWCITMGDATYYEQYTSSNVVFYFILSKTRNQTKDAYAKIALAVMRDVDNKVENTEFYTAKDKKISAKDASNKIRDFNEILNICLTDAVSRPMSLLAKLKNNKASTEEISIAYELFKDSTEAGSEEIIKLIAQNENTPADVLKQLAQNDSVPIKRFLAKNQNTPIEILRQLARDEDSEVRFNVGQNKMPVELLKQLAQDGDRTIRQSIARNKNIPIEIIKQFAQDTDDYVRMAIAANPSTTSEILKQLAQDKHETVRLYVARNLNTPVEVLSQLAQDEYYLVRLRVVENPNTPIDILKKLTQDEHDFVSKIAKKEIRKKAINKKMKSENIKHIELKSLIRETLKDIFSDTVSPASFDVVAKEYPDAIKGLYDDFGASSVKQLEDYTFYVDSGDVLCVEHPTAGEMEWDPEDKHWNKKNVL